MGNLDSNGLKEQFFNHLKGLQNLQFTFYNPVFWAAIFLLFLVLNRFWETKKAFQFCLILSVILLLTTEIEVKLARAVVNAEGPFGPEEMVRMFSAIIIVILFLLFAFIKK